jgi:catalase
MRSNILVATAFGVVVALCAPPVPAGAQETVAVEIVDQFNTLFGRHPHTRANHATGAVFEGTFTPAAGADKLSSALFLAGAPTPVTVRFSNGGGIPDVADQNPAIGGIRGMAVKLHLSDGGETDIVAISHNGFPVATGEDFLGLLRAVGESGPDAAKPTPIEKFLGAHPAALAFVTAPKPMPVSFGTLPYFGVNAFKFTNAAGETRFGRWRLVPDAGAAFVSDDEAAKREPHALADMLTGAVATAPVKFRLEVQIAAEGDPTGDATKVWPDDRPVIDLGEIAITKALDTAAVENDLLFLPTNLTDGIDISDDPLIELRTEAYAESFGRRQE